TVRLTLQRLAAAGLHWPLPAEMTDTALEAQLFAAVGKIGAAIMTTSRTRSDMHRLARSSIAGLPPIRQQIANTLISRYHPIDAPPSSFQ
ncbi:MAG: hypothetical protein WB611_33125, partial [Stellaceae bacterium]